MGEKRSKRGGSDYIMQGGILAAASILSRVIGMLYRLPVTNIIGDQGNSYYSAAYEVYNIILLISSYSLPLAVSKIVSAKVALGERRNAWRYFKAAMCMSLVVGALASALAFFGAGFFTGTLLNTPESELSLKVLSLAIFVMAIMGVLRGYFQGMGTMMPTAISQVIEQIVNAVVSIAAAGLLYSYGVSLDAKNGITGGTGGAVYGAAGSTLGTSLGAAAGLMFLVFVMLMYNRVLQKELRRDHVSEAQSYGSMLHILVLTIVPVILSTAVYNISGFIDQGIFKFLMLNIQDANKETVDIYWGIYVGKYKLLTNVPIAVASALSASTIPALTKARMAGNKKEMRAKTEGAVRMVMLICIPSAFGLTALGEPILNLLNWNTDESAPLMFFIGSAAVIFYGLSTLTNGILQGIDRMRIPVRNAVIALISHLLVLVVLVWFVGIHIYGVVIAYMFFAFLMCVLNGAAIRKYLNYRQEIKRTFLIPVVASFIMAISTWLLYEPLEAVMGNRPATVLCLLLSVALYVFFVLFLHGVTEEELSAFPKGRRIVWVLKKIRLL